MALTDENGGNFNVSMPVQPMGGYGYGMPYGGGFGGGFGFGDDWIVLFLIVMMFGGGWGGMGGFGGWGGGFGGMFEFPWLLNGQQNVLNGVNANTNAGFNQAALQSAIGDLNNNVVSGFGDVNLGIAGVNQNICQSTGQIQNALCQGFAGTTAAVTGAQNAITSQLYNNELANLNRSFAEQTANTQGFSNVQAQLAQNGYNQAAGTADLKYTIATENCADRAALSDGIRDIITAQTASTQRILDQLCQDKIDAKNDTIAQLRQELLYSRGQASQDVQTARILAGQTNEIDALYNRLSNCPIPSTPVYGRTPIFSCNNNSCGCGCGCGGNF